MRRAVVQNLEQDQERQQGQLADSRPLIAHVVFSFDIGGLENGVVNLINHLPHERYRHAIIALTEITDFKKRIQRDDVDFIELHKAPGQTVKLYPQLYRLFRTLRPAIVHTRNLAALECVVPAWAAGVPIRIHGEHGWDVADVAGQNRKHRWVRRCYSPFVSRYIALSQDIARYLQNDVGVAARRITQIYNGVDNQRFSPAACRTAIAGCAFADDASLMLIGTVGRMQAVKNQRLLTLAFIQLLSQQPALRDRVRLLMVGDGPLRNVCQQLLADHGLADLAWLPGERNDIPAVMQGLDVFVLPSLAEGISNTILEAMACGLPVIACAVGGNAELVLDQQTGLIVANDDVHALVAALQTLLEHRERARAMGEAGKARIHATFSMSRMMQAYQQVYDRALTAAGRLPATQLIKTLQPTKTSSETNSASRQKEY